MAPGDVRFHLFEAADVRDVDVALDAIRAWSMAVRGTDDEPDAAKG